jgi:hypothetical protein
VRQGQEQQTWVEDPPVRIPYKSLYSDPSKKEEGAGRGELYLFFIIL